MRPGARRARLTSAGAALLAAASVLACARDAARRADSARADSADSAGSAELARTAPEPSCGATGAAGDTGVRVLPVNRGTHGMSARVKWLVSPDGCSLLVEEDPTAVEAEMVPNGALLVSERPGSVDVVAVDTVWDVAPSPDWTRLAYGRAYVLQGAEQDTIPPARWRALARTTGMSAAALERESFAASGMSYARAVTIAYVRELALPSAARGDSATTGRAPGAAPARRVGFGGWRVAWRGDTAFFGTMPKGDQDTSPATRWRALAGGADSLVEIPADRAPAALPWQEGPTLDIGVPIDLKQSKAIALPRGSVEGRGGTIHLRRANGTERVVGPGVPLAATAGGRFVVALAPNEGAKEFEPKARLVVYEVRD